MELLTLLASTLPAAPSNLAAQKLLGVGDGALYTFPVQNLGEEGIQFVNASRVITAADFNGGIMAVTSSAATILTLPTFWRLGFTDSNSKKKVLTVMRAGLGALFVTPATYRGSVASQAAMLALPVVTPEDYCYRSDLGQFFVLTTGVPATLANWLSVPSGDANKPLQANVGINWGLNSQFDPQYLEADLPVMLTSKSTDQWRAN
jgi:hypothetical protein